MNDIRIGLRAPLARPAFTIAAILTLAVVAVTLAISGVYGVMAYTVMQRTQEIGVRVARSARRSQMSSPWW